MIILYGGLNKLNIVITRGRKRARDSIFSYGKTVIVMNIGNRKKIALSIFIALYMIKGMKGEAGISIPPNEVSVREPSLWLGVTLRTWRLHK